MGALYTLYIQTEGHIQMQDITAEVQAYCDSHK